MVSNIFYVHPYLGKIPILTSIFFKGVGSTTNQFLLETSMGFPTENLRVSSEPRSRDDSTTLLHGKIYAPKDWQVFILPWGMASGFNPIFFRVQRFRWWIMANPAKQSKLSPFFFWPNQTAMIFFVSAKSPVYPQSENSSELPPAMQSEEGTRVLGCPGTDVRING